MSTAIQRGPWLCQQCIRALRKTSRWSAGEDHVATHVQKRHRGDTTVAERQAIPLSGYYAELLDHPLARKSPAVGAAIDATLPHADRQRTQKEETIARARVVFGSRLAGPAERADELRKASSMVAGVLVPPKPDEPDNCCMSGCVNCVWDRYRDELEDWAVKGAEARAKLMAQRQSGEATGSRVQLQETPHHVLTSMDDDGGGSESNWTGGMPPRGNVDDLFQGIPVGIREFMRTEKVLRERHKLEGVTIAA